jgi:hypothetical protein
MFEEVTISLHYSRDRRRVSSRGRCYRAARGVSLALGGLLAVLPACAQYPGQIAKPDKEMPALRAVGVLEWTGDPGKPKTSRLVPITVFDGEQLQDGGVYLARPAPLAVQGGVEYILQKDGSRIGLFDIQSAGQEQGSWVGFGTWRAMPSAKPKSAMAPAKVDEEDEATDRPTLHRKSGSSSSGSDSGAGSAPVDPDRPTLQKKSSTDGSGSNTSAGGANSGNAGSGSSSSGGNTSSASAPPSDPNQPTLHTKTGSSSSGDSSNTSSTSSTADPDRPTLKRGKSNPETDAGYVEPQATATDPSRPKLQRGKSDGNVGPEVTPTMMGLPSDMEQTVAVSDPRNKPEHLWVFAWADPADELKMKADLENIARTALGLNGPATPASKAKAGTTTAARTRHATPAEPAPLAGEEFRVFELAYGAGATLVLTAHTDGPPEKRKYVTLIAQPDLYGSLLVLFKSVTDAAHLDDTPSMRLVDAVDAMADNRAELLFELRGATQRQFALYRVMRGTVEKLFVTSGGVYGSQAMN